MAIATLREAAWIFLKNPVDASKSSTAIKTLHCFSALNNSRKILLTAYTPGSFTCLHGIRVLSTTWVVMGHYIAIGVGGGNLGLFLAYKVYNEFSNFLKTIYNQFIIRYFHFHFYRML